jgi:tetratricopeptide (TPR) repeat protein
VAVVGLWSWKHFRSGPVHPDSVPLGFPTDTVLYPGRPVDLPGPMSGASDADRNLLRRALDARKSGDTARAMDMVDELLRRSSLPEADYYAAIWRQDRRTARDSARADSLVAKGLETDPGHPWLLLAQSRRFQVQGKAKESREILVKILDFAPTFRPAMEDLAGAELRAGNLPRAQRLSQLAISLAPRDQRRYDILAEILLARERDDSAREAIRLGLEAVPDQPRYLWIRGLLEESRGDTTEARKDYMAALSKERLPQAEEALRTLGLKPIHGAGRMGGAFGGATATQTGFAVEVLTPLVRAYPRSAPLQYALGRALQEQGYLGQADEAYQKALAIDSTVPGLVAWSRDNRHRLEEKARLFANRKDSSQGDAQEDTRWFDLGHYRVAWGVAREEFISQFASGRFEKPGPGILQERRTMWGIEHVHTLRFDSTGLWQVQVVLRDAGKASLDLLEEGIRLNALQAGSGSFNETKMCPGWGQVESVWWETADTYEFMALRPAQPKRLGLVRVRKERVPDGGICPLAALALDTTWK